MSKAKELAEEGRAKNFGHLTAGYTREQEGQDIIRWAFWSLADRSTQHSREMTEEERIVSTLMSVMSRARNDERRRIATAVVNGLEAMLGDEAKSLMYDVADAMNLFDH